MAQLHIVGKGDNAIWVGVDERSGRAVEVSPDALIAAHRRRRSEPVPEYGDPAYDAYLAAFLDDWDYVRTTEYWLS